MLVNKNPATVSQCAPQFSNTVFRREQKPVSSTWREFGHNIIISDNSSVCVLSCTNMSMMLFKLQQHEWGKNMMGLIKVKSQ